MVCFQLEFTLVICPFWSLISASRLRFSPRAVVRHASLELSKASMSFSLCEAPARSDSFLVFLQNQREPLLGGRHFPLIPTETSF